MALAVSGDVIGLVDPYPLTPRQRIALASRLLIEQRPSTIPPERWEAISDATAAALLAGELQALDQLTGRTLAAILESAK